MELSRRNFLIGCSTAIAAMAGGRVGHFAFANPAGPAAGTDEILVLVFLRGGMDGLSLVAPFDDPNYRQARGNLSIPETGTNKAILLPPQNPTFTSSLGLHSMASPLKELYDARDLAFIHACGLDDDTRSHFDAMDYIERGTPGNKTTGSGWLTRHLQTIDGAAGLIPALSANVSTPTSLLSSTEAVAMTSPQNFGLRSPWRYNNDNNDSMFAALKTLYPGSGANLLDIAGRRTIETIEAIQTANVDSYAPAPGVTYPDSSFGSSLKTVAQTIKLDLGVRVATVDLGGWDTHENQGSDGGGYFASQIDELSRGLHALYEDLAAYQDRLTVVVMSEFGRRLGANDSNGTDHGHGNVMLVIGGNVNGGKVYGNWPGIEPENLDQRQDLKITTDYRIILGEIVTRRLGNTKLGQVFPGLTADLYQPLGLVNGSVPGPIDFSSELRNARAARPGAASQVYLPLVTRC